MYANTRSPTSNIIFYGRAMTSEVEEARHEQTMPNEERAEPIELGLRGRERDFDRSALFLSRRPTGLPFASEAQLSFCFSLASLPVSTPVSLLSTSSESVSLSVSWQLMPNFWLHFTGQLQQLLPSSLPPWQSASV
jgi:hypothetical protein